MEELPSSMTESLPAVLTVVTGRYEQKLMQLCQKSLPSPNIVCNTRDVPRECSSPFTEKLSVKNCEISSQNNPVMDTVQKPTAESGGDSSSTEIISMAAQKEDKSSVSADIEPFTVDDLAHSFSKLEDRKVNDEPYIMEPQAKQELQISVEAMNSDVMDFLISETRTHGLVIGGNRIDNYSEMWKMGVTSCSAEMFLEDLFVRSFKLIGGFKEEPPPPSIIKASSQESVHVRIKNSAPPEKNSPSYALFSSLAAMSPFPDKWCSVSQMSTGI